MVTVNGRGQGYDESWDLGHFRPVRGITLNKLLIATLSLGALRRDAKARHDLEQHRVDMGDER